MQLYYSETLAPRKACAVARYLGLPIEYVFVDLGKGEHVAPAYLAINPNGKVPCLVDAERSIWEADAIICHLAQRAQSPLWPQNAEQQTDVLRWLSWNSQHFYRHGGTLYFEHLIKPAIGLGGPDSAKIAEAQGWFRKHAAVLVAARRRDEHCRLLGRRHVAVCVARRDAARRVSECRALA